MTEQQVVNHAATSQATLQNIPPITYQDQPVIPTDLLAKAYGAIPQNIRNNFSRNKQRFVEGKHFFSVSTRELRVITRDISLRYASPGSTQDNWVMPSLSGKSTTLYTKRGAALHAKMLNTDTAWELYEAMVDHYFESMDAVNSEVKAPSVHVLATVEQRRPLVEAVRTWGKMLGGDYAHAHKQVNAVIGVSSIEQMNPEQVNVGLAWVQDRIRKASQGATACVTINELMGAIKSIEEAAARIQGLAHQGAPTALLETLWMAVTKIAQGRLHLA